MEEIILYGLVKRKPEKDWFVIEKSGPQDLLSILPTIAGYRWKAEIQANPTVCGRACEDGFLQAWRFSNRDYVMVKNIRYVEILSISRQKNDHAQFSPQSLDFGLYNLKLDFLMAHGWPLSDHTSNTMNISMVRNHGANNSLLLSEKNHAKNFIFL